MPRSGLLSVQLACCLLVGCGRLSFEPLVLYEYEVASCGRAEQLTDDFEDGTIGPEWFTYVPTGTSIVETGGHIEVTFNGAPPVSFVELTSLRGYDLRGASYSVELVEPIPADIEAFLMAQTRDGNVSITVHGSTISFHDVDRMLASAAFDPASQRFLRIRETGGTTFFETSGDGVSYSEHASIETRDIMSSAQFNVGGILRGPGPTTLMLDRANGGGMPAGAWCPASSFVDDFDAAVRDPVWQRWGPCQPSVAGGDFAVTLPTGVAQSCGWGSGPAFDVRNGAFTIEAVQGPTPTVDGQGGFSVGAANNSIDIVLSRGEIAFGRRNNGVAETLATLPWDPATHRFWGIREAAGDIVWMTSDDGAVWVEQMRSPAWFDLTAVTVGLWAAIYSPAASSPGTVRFDNLNVFGP